MKIDAKKIIQSKVNTELDVQEIKLLSYDEWRECEDIIPIFDTPWWLSTSLSTNSAGGVTTNGYFSINYAYHCAFGVRPVLRILNLKDCNLNKGEMVELFRYKWTVISDTFVLCDTIVGEYPFRSDYWAPDACDYNAADVKKFVEKWFERKVEDGNYQNL